MNKIIVGSAAIKHYFPEFREPKDIDYICEEKSSKRTEENLWIPEFQYLVDANEGDYLCPDLMLTLKSSHFGWDIKWEKHRNDILFLREKGCKLNKEIYLKLYNGWKREHGEKWAKLGKKNVKDFFNDAVKRKYVHDDIHLVVAVNNKPVYFNILENGNSVKCLKEKFDKLSQEEKLLMAKEETWVTALERYLIPNDFTYSPKRAYSDSLKKLVTTMSSGWFKHFLIDNYHTLFRENSVEYIEKFKRNQNKLRLA